MPPKVVVRQKTTTATKTTQAPTPRAKAPVDPVTLVLTNLDLGEGRRLSAEQVNTLVNLEYANGGRILSKDRPQVTIDTINLLQKLPFEEVVTYLRESSSSKDLVMNSPLLENERERVQLEVDNLQSTIEAEEGVHQCESCGSERTIAFQKQVRSADEPMSTFVRCLGCGKRWRVD